MLIGLTVFPIMGKPIIEYKKTGGRIRRFPVFLYVPYRLDQLRSNSFSANEYLKFI